MKRAMNDEKGRTITLPHYLGSRLLPLAVLVASAVSLGAPAAMLDLRMRELRGQAQTTGRSVAALISREALQRPVLWRYDTLKLVEHVSAHEQQSNVRRIEITDLDGHPLGFGVGAAGLVGFAAFGAAVGSVVTQTMLRDSYQGSDLARVFR